MSKLTKTAVLATMVIGAPAIVHAAGFAIVEQNASRLGNAYAGGAAEANDASVIFYNPAGMARLEGRQVSVSGLVFLPKSEFRNSGSISADRVTPVTGGNGGNGAATSFIPNLYYMDSLPNGWKYGVSLTAPAGVRIDNGERWVGRYYSTESALEVLNISPAIAGKIGPNTSVGAALDIQYAHAKLSKAIDFGSICYGVAPPAFCGSQGLFPQSADGMAKVDGNDWSVGYHFGIQHDLSQDTRIGANYRSKVSHTIDGDVTFSNVPGFMAASFPNTGAKAAITLPEVVSLSAMHKLTPALTLLGDASWTRWSRFNELRIRFGSPAVADDLTVEDWKNSWRFALGVNYQYTSNLVLRAGVAHDQGPVQGSRRTPAIPDGTRNALAFGANYKLSPNSSIDVGYTHLFIPKGGVAQGSAVQGTLAGHYESSAEVIGVQYNHAF
jgi:long-chain fatty acid transport protein